MHFLGNTTSLKVVGCVCVSVLQCRLSSAGVGHVGAIGADATWRAGLCLFPSSVVSVLLR